MKRWPTAMPGVPRLHGGVDQSNPRNRTLPCRSLLLWKMPQ